MFVGCLQDSAITQFTQCVTRPNPANRKTSVPAGEAFSLALGEHESQDRFHVSVQVGEANSGSQKLNPPFYHKNAKASLEKKSCLARIGHIDLSLGLGSHRIASRIRKWRPADGHRMTTRIPHRQRHRIPQLFALQSRPAKTNTPENRAATATPLLPPDSPRCRSRLQAPPA